MKIFLTVTASDWRGRPVPCYFTATADSFEMLSPSNDEWGKSKAPVYELPPKTKEVTVTATPIGDTYWPRTISFSVSDSGSFTPDSESKGFVWLASAPSPQKQLTNAKFKMSQFQDSTKRAVKLLQDPPKTRSISVGGKKPVIKGKADGVDELKFHQDRYGTWPPTAEWRLDGVPHVDFLDVGNPLTSGALNFAPAPPSLGTPLDVNVDSVVLELAGNNQVPRFFAVTWPRALYLNPAPAPFLIYIRQFNRDNYAENGIFVGGELDSKPYPENFDYADVGMFESLHYAGPTPDSPRLRVRARSPLWFPNAKGVPYQAAKAGANVVCVFPCNKFKLFEKDPPEFGVLNDPEATEAILLELQAFMFWKGLVDSPPTSIGKTAIAAFSSGTFFLGNWLKDEAKRKGHFLSKVVRAVYFLEPMRAYQDKPTGKMVQVLNTFVDSALKWADQDPDKRIRLYMQFKWDSLQKLIDETLPAPPYFAGSTSTNRTNRTVSVVTEPTWTKTVGRPASNPLPWDVIHHAFAATMLTHALAQGDF